MRVQQSSNGKIDVPLNENTEVLPLLEYRKGFMIHATTVDYHYAWGRPATTDDAVIAAGTPFAMNVSVPEDSFNVLCTSNVTIHRYQWA